jgi:hypothetical protein
VATKPCYYQFDFQSQISGKLKTGNTVARLAQSVERKALNLVVVGSSPTVGAFSSGALLFLGHTKVDVIAGARLEVYIV